MTAQKNRKEWWEDLVAESKEEIENFNNFQSDDAIVWADNQLTAYKKELLAMANGNNNWAQGVSDDDQKLITTMIRRAEGVQI